MFFDIYVNLCDGDHSRIVRMFTDRFMKFRLNIVTSKKTWRSVMVAQKSFDAQLKQLSLRFRLFGRAEIRELRKILQTHEKIKHCIYGFYQGGSGLLVATDHRILLIDKRPFYVNVEDVHYATVRDIDFTPRALQGALHIISDSKKLVFRSVSDARLRRLRDYVQKQVIENYYTVPEPKTRVRNNQFKPYLDPAWRPHHTSMLRRPRPSKSYCPPEGLVLLITVVWLLGPLL